MAANKSAPSSPDAGRVLGSALFFLFPPGNPVPTRSNWLVLWPIYHMRTFEVNKTLPWFIEVLRLCPKFGSILEQLRSSRFLEWLF